MAQHKRHTRHATDKSSRQRQRRTARDATQRHWQEARSPSRSALPADVRLLELLITEEPGENPEFDALSEDLKLELEPFLTEPVETLADWVPQLEDWIARGAHVPQLYNRLAGGYLQLGRLSDARDLVRQTYERFPKYFFARTEYARQRLQEGFRDEVPGILGGSMAIDDVADGRTVLHPSELRAWALLIVEYSLSDGEIGPAKAALELVESVSPEHPGARQMRAMIRRAEWKGMLDGLLGSLRSSRRRRTRKKS